MSEESAELNPKRNSLEAALSALVPARGTLDADALLFAAGHAAGLSEARRRQRWLAWSQPLWAAACLGLVWMQMPTPGTPQQTLPPASMATPNDRSGEQVVSQPTSNRHKATQEAVPLDDAPMNYLRYRDEVLAQALSTSFVNPPAKEIVRCLDQAALEEDRPSQSPSPLQQRRQMVDALLRL